MASRIFGLQVFRLFLSQVIGPWRRTALLCACALAGPCVSSTALAFEIPFISRLFGAKEDEKPSVPAPDAVAYKTTIEVANDPDGLTDKLKSASNLVRLEKDPPSGPSGLARRAAAEGDRLYSALSALGYFSATLTVEVAGVSVQASGVEAAIARARRDGPVPVKVSVTPGPLFTMGEVRFADAKTGRPLPDPADRKRLGLLPDAPARSAAVIAAEQVIVDAYREQGYAFAKVPSLDAVADHARLKLDVTFKVEPGRQVAFGEATVSGTDRMKPSFIEERQPYTPGDLFSPEPLAKWRKDLGKYEVFDSIRIREGETLDAEGRLPIFVDVKERLPRVVGFGVKYSTTEGPSANAYWMHRNLFGGAEQLRLDAQVSRASQDVRQFLKDFGVSSKKASLYGFKVGATFTKPGIITVDDDLVVQTAVLREATKAYNRDAVTAALGIKHRFNDYLTAQFGIEFERGRTRDPLANVPIPPFLLALATPDQLADLAASSRYSYYTMVGLPLEVVYDSTDRPLDPRRGIKVSATVEPFLSALGSTVDVTLFKGSISAYHAFDEDGRYILAGRLAAGSLVGASLNDIPLPRRFFAGGGGSIRGYDYQEVGPKDLFGRPTGGRSLLEASVEMRVKVTETIGVVPFLDAGGAFDSAYPDFKENIKYGAGVGLRYYTSIGPIRLDVARGLNRDRGDPAYAIYLSLGQAF